ncbi:MAG: gluconate 5-dehydrogenase [Proteiniphilum sp.]
MVNFSLEGKIALITGAAHGIGFSMAAALAKAGARIAFNSSNEASMNRGLEEYKKIGINAKGYVCDVRDEKAVKVMIDSIINEIGEIDILVNNAGIIKRIPAVDMKIEEYHDVIDTDLVAPFILSKIVAPSMIRRGGGKIINICSLMSELGRETVSAYAAAKGGLKMLTRTLASEWGKYNIQVNGLGPGYIATSQTAPLREKQPDGTPHPFDSFIISKTPAERWGTPDDLAGPAVFLASEASNFVNGHILYVDGGILAYIGKQP